MAEKKITLQQSPNLAGPIPEFIKNEFDRAVWAKGYFVIHEKAIMCPCGSTPGHFNPGCPACGGNGYFFVDPVKTRALITGVNVDTKYKEWTIDRAGTISVTIQDEGPKLSFYDRITFTEKFGFYSENYLVNEKSFVWLTFEPIEILGVYFYNIETNQPELLPNTAYSVNESNNYVLEIVDKSLSGKIISVYYKHHVQYNIIDLPHEIRASNVVDSNGNLSKIDLPDQAIARRANFFVGKTQIISEEDL